MKKKQILLSLSVLSLLNIYQAKAQTTIDAEIRPRIEYREGFRKPLIDTLAPSFLTLQRTRLNIDYSGKILNARISFQDARIWGNSDNKTNYSKIEMNEAWFEYLIVSGLSLKMGRQPLKYDDQRLLAAPNWSNTGTSHDVLVAKYNSKIIQMHTGFAFNNSKDTLYNYSYAYTPKQNYKMMNYFWLSKPIYKGLNLTCIGIVEEFEKKTNNNILYSRVTYGGNLIYSNDSSAWDATLTAYKQEGIDPNKAFGAKYATLNAYFLAAKGSYKINKKLTVNAGIDYYSGSSTTIATNKSNTFNRLYGATHSYNGSMEYFVTLPTQGLKDFYCGISTKITSKFSIDLSGHTFYFDKKFIYKNVGTEYCLGQEIDLTLNYVVSKEISIQGGYSQFLKSGSTKKYYKMYNVKTYQPQWAFIMFTIRPQLYKTPVVKENN
ncbi:MAG: alginate export family protein [Bacteroidota bacterium]